MKITQPTPFILAAALMSGCIAYIAYMGASSDKDATTRTAATTRNHAETPAPPLITIKKLPAPLKAQPPTATAYPDIAQNPEAIKVIKLERLKKVFPNLQDIPPDWRTFNPQILTIAPYEDIQIPFQLDEAKIIKPNPTSDSPDARIVQVYRNDMQGGYTVTAATENEMIAIVTVPGADIFEVHVLDGDVAVTTAPVGYCGNTPAHDKAYAYSMDQNHQILEAGNPNTHTTQADTIYISNVIFFYNGDTFDPAKNFTWYDAETPAQAETTVTTRYIAQLEAGNVVLANSEVNNLRWNFIGTFKTQNLVFNKHNIENYVDFLKSYVQPSAANKEAYDFVQAKIAETKANQAVFISARFAEGGADGIATTPGTTAVVAIGTDYTTLTHELGHNFGCNHDRETDNVPISNTNYYFGYSYEQRKDLWTTTQVGTIMSYANSPIPYFSNPSITFQSVVNGYTYEPHVIGIPAGEPGASDNARWLRENGPYTLNLGTAQQDAIPVITSQPQSGTLIKGDTLTLTVSATSNLPLTYQWNKGGAAISGATSTTYTKNNITTADAGDYTVTVANSRTSTTSKTATITIYNEAGSFPGFTSQPQNVTVNQGGSFTLTTSATGGNLSYQWRRNSVNMSLNAHSPTYTKSNANASDTGTYTCIVSNNHGTITSNPATVTVTSTSSNNNGGNNSNNSGGGGGGAPSLLCLTAIGIIGLLKHLKR